MLDSVADLVNSKNCKYFWEFFTLKHLFNEIFFWFIQMHLSWTRQFPKSVQGIFQRFESSKYGELCVHSVHETCDDNICYLNFLLQVDSEFARKLDTFIQAKCATNQQMDEFAAFLPNHHWSLEGNNIFSSRATPAESIITALICMNSTIIENLEGTGHEGIYAKYQPTFANIIKRLRKCGESEL